MALPSSPSTIPNRFDFAEAQPRIYEFWEQGGYFHSQPDLRETYTIVIPPPNVTGALHLGHALNNSLQDIVIRFRRMQGFNTLWMPGTDHAGIATQAVVEKRLLEEEGKTRHDLGREQLVERIWNWKDQYETRIISQLKQMGCSCDWERTRFTLDDTCARAVRQTFFNLFGEGLIYRGKRLVNWDTHLQTAISDDEVYHEAVQGHFWHIRYPVIDPKPGEPTHVTVATTRPETMLADTAVAVHPDPAKALDKVEAKLEKELSKASNSQRPLTEQELDGLRQRRQTMLNDLEQLRDMAHDGRQVLLPLLDRPIPLLCDEWAKPEMGSGSVKITPAHDPNDYDVWQRHPDIGAVNILNPEGTLTKEAGPYQGMTVDQSRRKVVADLQQRGYLVQVEDREIDLAHSDRSKTPIEPFLADQWFVQMDQLAKDAMDAVTDGRVKIIPRRYAKSYLDWLGEKRDWCISRNLWWGHRIPVWRKQLKAADFGSDETSIRFVDPPADSTPWSGQCLKPKYQGSATDQSRRYTDEDGNDMMELAICVAPGNDQLEKDLEQAGFQQEPEVLDTWFSSALWPHSTLGWPEQTAELEAYYPTSTLITSRDIITLWVARMVLTGLQNVGEVPFREVFIHPKILDGYGETMSKSKGNGVDPIDVIEKFGADALRYGLAYLTTETQDVRMPVQFECPHCDHLIDQTKKIRQLPRIDCTKCGKPFSTQWANRPEDRALPRGPVVSERFELARNFCNKLWNASRFALLNLADYMPGPVADDELAIEDRWILSRMATVTQQVTQALETYRYAEAARTLYDFAWDEFCSFYVEMVKRRLQDEQQRVVAQRVMAHTLDVLLRLLHPMIPYITEEVWQALGQAAGERGLGKPGPATASIMESAWPEPDAARIDAETEARFATFQAVLGALREIRSGQNISPREAIRFSVRCDALTVDLLDPMKLQFEAMAMATATELGSDVQPPPTYAKVQLTGIDVYVDLKGLIDVGAEIERNTKDLEKVLKLIQGKKAKLANAKFVERAPADIVQGERDSLAQLKQQSASIEAVLNELRKSE